LRAFLIRSLCLLLVAAFGYFAWQLWVLESRQIAVSTAPPVVPPVVRSPSGEALASPDDAADVPEAAASLSPSAPVSRIPPTAPAHERAPSLSEAIVLQVHQDRAPKMPSALQQAQAALARGDLDEARTRFSAFLAADPHHLEALLGMADIALRQDEGAAAWRFYQAALNAHPADARAQTGMLALAAAAGQVDAQTLEGRLKTLMIEAPQAATPYFAFGNLLAAQGRWREAQNAYFEACRRDRTNPDFRYNLAVSLERLNQPRLAAEQYQAALAAVAAGAPANFAVAAAESRLRVLLALPEEAAP
jgi:tetratricopeptide (TPR) repeat protein